MGTPVWPTEHDAKIREVAGELGDTAAIAILDKLKDILGDAPQVEHYAEVWSPDTMELLSNAQEDFGKCVSNINDVWQGPGADEFKAWATKYHNSLNDFKGQLDTMRKCLFDCSRTITNVYRSAIELVAKIGATLVKLTTGIAGSVINPFNIAGVLGDALAALIERAGQLIGEGLQRMQEYRSIMSEIDSKVASLADLVPMGHMVSETGNWEVRAAS